MTNFEYLKAQSVEWSVEWLAAKLVEIMDCGYCPAAVYCDKCNGPFYELDISECQRTMENWLKAERTEGQ